MTRSIFLLITLGTAFCSAEINQNLHPFTHVALIPAQSDTSTIRFVKIRKVEVPTRVSSTIDPAYCEEISRRDPGGSMYCPYTQTGSRSSAYEVTYSFSGPALGSDESGNGNFSFQIYFRPDELTPELRRALAAKSSSRADLAAYFTVETRQESVPMMAIDDTQSTFCDGNFMDGAWKNENSGCRDKVSYKPVIALSGYLTVRVKASSLSATASVATR
jgi:hypothetical protein